MVQISGRLVQLANIFLKRKQQLSPFHKKDQLMFHVIAKTIENGPTLVWHAIKFCKVHMKMNHQDINKSMYISQGILKQYSKAEYQITYFSSPYSVQNNMLPIVILIFFNYEKWNLNV